MRLRRVRAGLRALVGWRLGLLLFALGAFGVAGFAPFHVQPALAAALVGLVLALDDAKRRPRPMRAGFFRAWAFAAGFFLAGTFWVANAFLVSAGDHAWLLWLPLVVLPAGLALLWGAAGAAYARLAPAGPNRVLVFVGVVFAAEWARASLFSGFPWNLPGHVWAAGGAMSQTAALIGVTGLSAFTLFALAAPAALLGSGPRAARAVAPVAAAILLAAGWGWGAARLADAEPSPSGATLRLVQHAFPQAEKRYENRFAVLEAYLEDTAAPGLERVDAVVWPEGAVPALLLNEPELLSRIAPVLQGGPPLIAGTTRVDLGYEPYRAYNALAALTFTEAGPRLLDVYDKAKLVPLGEGNPARPLTERFGFTSLSELVPFFTPGEGARTLSLPGLPDFAPLICYEVIYPRFAPRGEARPAFLLNISNDAWYGHSTGPRQHFNQARYRAIEEGLPLVRSAASGYSGLIDPWGRSVISSGPEGYSRLDVQMLDPIAKTVYAVHGPSAWAPLAAVMAALVALAHYFAANAIRLTRDQP